MWHRWLAVLLFLVFAAPLALAASTTPTSDFIDNGDGTVLHKTTGLTWKRCSEGQTWTGAVCSGTAQKYLWSQANALTSGGWRLPTIAELVTIVERDNLNPALNTTIFPSTPDVFWSVSAAVGVSEYAWGVHFGAGIEKTYRTENSYYYYDDTSVKVVASVRLVRGGQVLDSSGLYTPDSDFSDNGDGSVTHKKTNLTWKRCAEGQTWTGSACSGTANKHTWSAAKTLSVGGWRLPSQNELLTIVEWSKTEQPAINTTIFPNTPLFQFWSASAFASAYGYAWFIYSWGQSGFSIYETSSYAVRLVRDGQYVPTPTNKPPTASFTYTPSGTAPLAVSLDATPSSDPDGSIVSYAWSSSDGQSASGKNASLTITQAGIYTIILTITDDKGATASISASVTVTAAAATANKTPLPMFTASLASVPLTVSLDASASNDTDGSIVSYAWKSSDGQSTSGKNATLTFANAGTYTVTLTVTDDKGASASAEAFVTVAGVTNKLPLASFTATPTSGTAPLAVNLDASASSDADGSIASYVWKSSDGQSTSGKNATLTFSKAGTYTVTLTVTDDKGASASVEKTVTVTATAATTEYTDNGDGTVTHKTTGLTWKRCSEGQTWSGSTCSGTAQSFTWSQANARASGGWRLPRIDELVTIVECDNFNPVINTTIFPNTPASFFWSASAYAGNSDGAWYVNFYFGNRAPLFKESGYVRLVRGGQSSDSSNLYTPTSDFNDNRDGSVIHKKTSLIWKRCAEGQSWSGSACTGTAKTYTWNAANALGGGGWRLPSINELQTLVEYSIAYPGSTINTTIFPDTPASYFWSASAYAGNSVSAWGVHFDNGRGDYEPKGDSRHVRLVRGELTAAPSPLNDTERLFNWAESAYTQYFVPARPVIQEIQGYTYRYYSGSKNYLAVKDGKLWLLGPLSQDKILDLGPLSDWLGKAKAAGF